MPACARAATQFGDWGLAGNTGLGIHPPGPGEEGDATGLQPAVSPFAALSGKRSSSDGASPLAFSTSHQHSASSAAQRTASRGLGSPFPGERMASGQQLSRQLSHPPSRTATGLTAATASGSTSGGDGTLLPGWGTLPNRLSQDSGGGGSGPGGGGHQDRDKVAGLLSTDWVIDAGAVQVASC